MSLENIESMQDIFLVVTVEFHIRLIRLILVLNEPNWSYTLLHIHRLWWELVLFLVVFQAKHLYNSCHLLTVFFKLLRFQVYWIVIFKRASQRQFVFFLRIIWFSLCLQLGSFCLGNRLNFFLSALVCNQSAFYMFQYSLLFRLHSLTGRHAFIWWHSTQGYFFESDAQLCLRLVHNKLVLRFITISVLIDKNFGGSGDKLLGVDWRCVLYAG